MVIDDFRILSELRERAQGKTILLDTSGIFYHNEFIGRVAFKNGKLRSKEITKKDAHYKTGYLMAFNKFLSSENMIVTKEVLRECSAGVYAIKKALETIAKRKKADPNGPSSRLYDSINGYWRQMVGINSKLNSRDLGISFSEGDDRLFDSLDYLVREEDRLFREDLGSDKVIFDKMQVEALKRRHDFKVKPEDYQGLTKISFIENYMPYLLLAMKEGRDSRKRSLLHANRNHKSGIGALLNTDSRVMATAFALSYHSDVLVFSADRDFTAIKEGIESLTNLRKIRERFGYSKNKTKRHFAEIQEKTGLGDLPSYSVEVYPGNETEDMGMFDLDI